MSTGKSILIAGAVVVGGIVLYELVLAPKSAAVKASALAQANAGSFVALGASVGQLFNGIFSSSSKAPASSAVSGGSYTSGSFTGAPGYVYNAPDAPLTIDSAAEQQAAGNTTVDELGNPFAGSAFDFFN